MANVIHVYIAEPTPTPMKQNMFLQFPFKQNIGLSPSNQQNEMGSLTFGTLIFEG